MAQIRVLVVDDSAFARVALTRLLSSDPKIEVVGEAKDGLEALAKVNELKPDVITLDVTMPNLDGLQTLERLMRERPTPTVMVSALTRAGADVTLEALAKGAVDFIPKVARSRGGALVQTMDGELVTKVKAAAGARIAAPAQKYLAAYPRRPVIGWIGSLLSHHRRAAPKPCQRSYQPCRGTLARQSSSCSIYQPR